MMDVDQFRDWMIDHLDREQVEHVGVAIVLQRRGAPPRQDRSMTVTLRDGSRWRVEMEPVQ